MSIADWPDEERPREKLLIRGPAALSDAELLAIFLRTGVAGKTALDLARELLVEFGGLRLLLESDQHRLCQAKGLGPAKYVQLQAGLELARRYFASHLHRGELLSSPRDTANYLNAKLRGYSFEVFACLFLDTHHRVISFEEMFRGTIDMTSVHPREVVRRALEQRAAAVILAHNHPSGVQEPSQADRLLTERLQKALALVDIRVLDHFIIGDGPAISFAEQGWI